LASSAYTKPLSLLMNTAPPTTVGWLHAAAPAPGMANAHFSFNFGTWSALIPAAAAGWNRHCVSGSGLHPFHRGCVHGLASASGAGQRFFIEEAARGRPPPNDLPVTNSAIIRLSASLMFVALLTIAPVVSAAKTRSGVNWRSASRLGARLSGAGLS
jgi:hypothetical protein